MTQKKYTDEIVERAQKRARMQAEAKILALPSGSLLPFQKTKLEDFAAEFGLEAFDGVLAGVLEGNALAKKNGNWPGLTSRTVGSEPQHPGTFMHGASVADERHVPGTAGYAFERMSAKDKHDFLKTHGEAAFAALREDWVRRGSPR